MKIRQLSQSFQKSAEEIWATFKGILGKIEIYQP